jgi:predicted GNAT family N-acyltransferase
MEIKPYSKDHFDQCVEIFKSNQDVYFAEDELQEYISFLQKAAHVHPYFVLLDQHTVIACGGFIKDDDEVILTWGMVTRHLHGHGYGKILTTYRVNSIQSAYPNTAIKIETSQFSKGFYEKQGFTTLSIEKNGIAQGLDKYTMRYTPICE